MKFKNSIIIFSIILNIVLITYVLLKINHLNNAYSNLSFALQGDLVQLESAINYQIKNNWKDENTVIEKIEDINESINNLMVTGKDSGIITKTQENDLWKLFSFFSNYPTYTGFPNTKLDKNKINKLVELKEDLRPAGWGMNLGYNSDWESFSKKINTLIKEHM
jgi:hypothetical protein